MSYTVSRTHEARSTSNRGPGVVVVGAGIVGASVTYHLARRGASVTLVDHGRPAAGCTTKSFAWIGPAEPSAFLGSQPIEDYRRLEHELGPALEVHWSGALQWWQDPADTERYAAERVHAGHDIRLMERSEVQRLEPNLQAVPELAAFASGAGGIDPVDTTNLLIAAAQDAGANVLLETDIASLVAKGGKIIGVRIGSRVLDADVVVVAAGVGTSVLTEAVGVPLKVGSSPALLVKLSTPGPIVNTVLASEFREFRQLSPNTLLSPETDLRGGTEAAAQTVLRQALEMLKGANAMRIEGAEIGWRPMPVDGLPIVGFAPQVAGLYITVMHSGVYLAPCIGRLAAVEILDEIDIRALDAYRPGRFFAQDDIPRR